MTAHRKRRRAARAGLCSIVLGAFTVMAKAGPEEIVNFQPAWAAESDQQVSGFGVSVASADIDGDGNDDILVGASLFDQPFEDEGRVYGYFGGAVGPSLTVDWSARGGQPEAWLGFTIANAGDLNGDGFEDVVAGAHGFDHGQVDEGRVLVWFGSPAGPGEFPDRTLEIDRESAFFGKSVSSAGDVNGDGYGDLIVGAWGYTNGEQQEGAAFVYLGSASGPSPVPVWSFESNQRSALAGFSVAGAGDVNGDGWDDVLVGAHLYDGSLDNGGRVWLFLGSANGVEASPAWFVDGDEAGSFLGYAVAGAGDVNGDGYDEILIGAPGHDGGQLNRGRAYLYLGSPSGPGSQPSWVVEGADRSELGSSLATAGDVNVDGFADVIVGAPRYDAGFGPTGQAMLYLGSPAGLSMSPSWSATGSEPSDYFGGSVSAGGDLNGDGFGDLLVGAQAAENGQFVEGRAFAFLGMRPATFALRVSFAGHGSGTIQSTPPGIDCGTDCVELYQDGTVVSLSATPDPGSIFGGWTGDAGCEGGEVPVVRPIDCVAVFHLEDEQCVDEDGDGFGSPGSFVCRNGDAEDCDDSSSVRHPGAPEICDGLDNDCDGLVDQIECDTLDANGDGRADGVELIWIGRAFGVLSAVPATQWWYPVDYTRDGRIDGEDLGMLGAVWGCQGLRNVCE